MSNHLLTATNATSCRTTLNHKYEGRPVVQLVGLEEHVYPPEDLHALLPRLMAIPRSGNLPHLGELPPVGSDPPVPLSRSALRVWTGEDVKFTESGAVDRSSSLIRIARVLLQASAPREVIVAALAERDAALGWRKYSDRREGREQYHRVVDVVERGVPAQRRH